MTMTHRVPPSALNPDARKSLLCFRPARLAFIAILTFMLQSAQMAFMLLGAPTTADAIPKPNPGSLGSASGCQLDAQSQIQHVIYIQFDNVHFTRDNPNVPSDLEQMPHLLNFIKSNGTLLANHHTPLISHTAVDILTSETGVYGDHHGVPIGNAFGYFNGSAVSFASSFGYWTDPVSSTDTSFNMLTASGKNAPAPWVPYTRSGCNFGTVASANTELEGLADVAQVFGQNSKQAAEAQSNPSQANADFIGIAVHCASRNALCSANNGGISDVLADEPGGYSGFNALYGSKYVIPQISPGGMTDLFGNPLNGFPGFDGMVASVSLAYVAAMQEHGVPVTYAYISDAHENHTTDQPYGPGQGGYVAQLQTYDQAFADFFSRLQKDGIDQSNTIFIITADEGDHFVGGAPVAPCDGVTVPCSYNQIGEIDINMTGLLATEQSITTPFQIHFDMAPSIYLDGNPASTDPATRAFERAVGKLTAVNPLTSNTDQLTKYLADPIELQLLHMITADPSRTPTFVMFGDPDYFFLTGAASCASSPCVSEDSGFAWNHGGVAPDINTTWLGMVGPGVAKIGVDTTTWSDHTDIRPTMLLLLGRQDDYTHDGRALAEDLDSQALPQAVRTNSSEFVKLAQALKQINAPVGPLGLASLRVSTTALESNAPNDQTYTDLEGQLNNILSQRNALAAQMIQILEGAEFGGQSINPQQVDQLVSEAQALLNQVNTLAGSQ